MKAAEIPMQSIPMTAFNARCTEYVRAVENGEPSISITRHGKVVAKLIGPEESATPTRTLANYMGSLRGTVTFSPDYDPHAPAFEDDEWEMND